MDEAQVLGVALVIIGLLFAVAIYFIKKTLDTLDAKADKSDLTELKCEVNDNKIAIGKIRDNYLTKEDFFREQTKTEKKLDEMLKILIDIKRGDGK